MLVCAAQSLRGQIRKGFPILPPPLKSKYHLSPFKNLVKGELEALGRKGRGGAGRKRKTSQRRKITICPWRQMCGPRTLATRVGVWEANGLLLQEAPRIGIQPVPAQESPMSPLSLSRKYDIWSQFLWRPGPGWQLDPLELAFLPTSRGGETLRNTALVLWAGMNL